MNTDTKVQSVSEKRNGIAGRILANRTITLLVLILLLGILLSVLFPSTFPTVDNFQAIIVNLSTESIVTIGMMILLISGVFDLSVGSMLALSGSLTGFLIANAGIPIPLAILFSILVCMAIGLIIGLIIAKIGVNPMIVTLSAMQIVRGMATLIAGTGIVDLTESFTCISSTDFLGIKGFKLSIIYMVILLVVFAFLVSKTKFFRRYYYIGGNVNAASLSGINVVFMRAFSYTLSACLAGIAGIIFTARLGSAVSTIGQGMEMRAITACILGGAALSGGTGSVFGAFLGVLFMAMISNFMVIASVSVYWQNIIIGGILLAAVIMDAVVSKRRLK